jgi:hypothetical protein
MFRCHGEKLGALVALICVAHVGCGKPEDEEPRPSSSESPLTIPPLPPPPSVAQDWPAVVDLRVCRPTHYHRTLEEGVAWLRVDPTEDACELWFGGQTNDPTYDGRPTQYCSFARAGKLKLPQPERGGPVWLDHLACTPPPGAEPPSEGAPPRAK